MVMVCALGHHFPLSNKGLPEWPLQHPTQCDYLCSGDQIHAQSFPSKVDMTSSEHCVMMYQ